MFGYVRARRADLLVREDMLYRGVYCGLCRAMGRCTGQCSRLTLSYDMVFLYLVRASLVGVKPDVQPGRCAVHPFRRRPIARRDAELEYAARVSALLVYGKLCDDLADERGLRRFGKRLLAPAARRMRKRAGLDDLYAELCARLTELSAIEAEKRESVDAPADCFGRLLAAVFAHGLSGDAATIASAIGYRTGRWIYAVDAADDLAEDAKKGSYNPFLLLYGGMPGDAQRALMESAMRIDLVEIENACALIPESETLAVVRNIAGRGMADAAHRALHPAEPGGKDEQKPI